MKGEVRECDLMVTLGCCPRGRAGTLPCKIICQHTCVDGGIKIVLNLALVRFNFLDPVDEVIEYRFRFRLRIPHS